MSGNKKKSGFVAIISAIIAVAALIIIMSVVGSPTGNTPHLAEGTQTATTQAGDNKDSKEASESEKADKKSDETKESDKDDEKETTEASSSSKSKMGGIHPDFLDDAIKTEKNAKKKVYLTFDDGPSKYTDEVLDVLDKYDVKATFFNVSAGNSKYLDSEKKTYEKGHTVAIHTKSHEYDEVYGSFENWKADVLAQQESMEENTGAITKFYRFPGGSSNTMGVKYGTDIHDCVDWLEKNGYEYYDWNVSNDDSEGVAYSPSELANNVLDYIGDGDEYMVLMHDTGAKENTLKSLPIIIEELKDRGFTLCQITENTSPYHHRIYGDSE